MKNGTSKNRFSTINKVCLSIFNEKCTKPSARLVWLILWRNAMPNGKVNISYNRIADETGLSRRICMTLVGELIKQGLVKLLIRGGMPDRVNQYKIKTYL